MQDKDFENIVKKSFEVARKSFNSSVDIEHLLFVISKSKETKLFFNTLGLKIDDLHKDIQKLLSNKKTLDNSSYDFLRVTLSDRFKRIIRKSFVIIEAKIAKISRLDIAVLFVIAQEKDSELATILESYGITEQSIEKVLSMQLEPIRLDIDITSFESEYDEEDEEYEDRDSGSKNFLDSFTVNLNQRALDSKIDPVIGRSKEIIRLEQILLRRKKSNALLIGEPGVGKTAIVEGVALKITQGKTSSFLKGATIYALNISSLMAGTKYRGDFEFRLEGVFNDLKSEPNAILYIDEIHMVIGAGSSQEDGTDIANLLKPVLTSGDIRCIGSTTVDEYRKVFSKDKALSRRFQTIDVLEPSKKDTYKILKQIQPIYEKYHNISYLDESLKLAIDLAHRFMHDKFFPDKVIDIMDEAGTKLKLFNSIKKKDGNNVIEKKHITSVVAEMTNTPDETLDLDARTSIKNLETSLSKNIFGQLEAIKQLVFSVKIAKSILIDKTKPLAKFLFVGPTGVGKTEVCKQLASSLHVKLLRFDMSEYVEPHSISRLVGSPPGYVGHSQAGMLTEAVWKNPYSVVLFDEIEKAHPNVYGLLLQIMDYGILTDSQGRDVNFKNCIIAMTSNIGVAHASRNNMGFYSDDNQNSEIMAEVKKTFTPEFRNRLDEVILFNPISKEIAFSVLQSKIKQLKKELKEHKVKLSVSKGASDILLEKGFDKSMGARPMDRAIRKFIRQPLSEILLDFVELGSKELDIIVGIKKTKKGNKIEVAIKNKNKKTPDKKTKRVSQKV